jgi:protein TonB
MYQAPTRGVRRVFGTGFLVAAVQIGIGTALLSAFAGGAFKDVVHQTLNPKTWTYMPPPKPQPQPQPKHTTHKTAQDHTVMTAPQPEIPGLGKGGGLTLGPLLPLPLPGGDDRAVLTDGPPPRLALPPVRARPLGNPGLWITPNDYPLRALRESWGGVTRLHLVVGDDGHVNTCSIIASSGHAELDAVACTKVAERARFAPARDSTGAPSEGSYDSAIRWQVTDIDR